MFLPWRTLAFAPHRAFFLLGSCNAVLTIGAWLVYRIWVLAGQAPPLAANPLALHLASMVFGLFMPFILGFILTVFPRWLSQATPQPPIHQLIFLLYALGWLAFLPGLFYLPALLVASALIALALLFASASLLHSLWQAKDAERLQPTISWLGFAGTALGATLAPFAWTSTDPLPQRIFQAILIHGALPILFLSISWRMVPFFTRNQVPGYQGRRSDNALYAWALFCTLKAIAFSLQNQPALLIADAGLLITTLYQFKLWRFCGPKPNMLLQSLYYALAWFPISQVLYLIRDLQALRQGYVNPFLEMAAVHALTVGAFAGMLMAFATRVTLGHSGRPLQTDSYDNALIALLHLTAATRVGIALMALFSPIWAARGHWPAALWLLAFGLWSARYIPVYWRPRVDGKPG